MRRIALFGGAAVWPLVASGQQSRTPLIGLLNTVSFESYAARVSALRQGLKEAGFVEGQNITIEYRSAEGRSEQLTTLATDLVRLRVAVIVGMGGESPVRAAKVATSTIPIVFAVGGDPVDLGLLHNPGRPEANVTGVTFSSTEMTGKRFQLLRDLSPEATLIGFLLSPRTNPRYYDLELKRVAAMGHSLGREVVILNASTEQEIDSAFATLVQQRIGALLVSNDSLFIAQHHQIIGLAARYSVPTMYPYREHVLSGGLISYGTDVNEMNRQAGIYVGRILNGEKPGDLPVLAPTKFELIINVRTAKTIGLVVPSSLLAIANEVIE